jgi:hypothetical protein
LASALKETKGVISMAASPINPERLVATVTFLGITESSRSYLGNNLSLDYSPG